MISGSIQISKLYTFAMTKYVYVQVRGVEKPAKIEADSAEEVGELGTREFTLSIKAGEKEIGKFRGNEISGWWIQDE